MNEAKLYVGNLDYSVTDDQLGELFGQVGTVVSVVVITDRYTGRSKGFAFVEMSSPEEAQEAIKKFNGQKFPGGKPASEREMVVNIARPREPRREGSRSRGGFDDRSRTN